MIAARPDQSGCGCSDHLRFRADDAIDVSHETSLYQIALGVCQAGIAICVVVVEMMPNGPGWYSDRCNVHFTIILLNSRGIKLERGVLCVAAGTAYHFGWRHDDTFWLRSFAGAILVGFYGCMVVAFGVVAVKWVARLLVGIPWRVLWNIPWRYSGDKRTGKRETSDRVTKLKLNEVKPAGDESREPIFGPGAPGALVYVVGQVLVAFLYAWLSSSH